MNAHNYKIEKGDRKVRCVLVANVICNLIKIGVHVCGETPKITSKLPFTLRFCCVVHVFL